MDARLRLVQRVGDVYELLPSHQRDVEKAIASAGLRVEDFEWLSLPSDRQMNAQVTLLNHRPTEFYFLFDVLNDRHFAQFSPGESIRVEQEYSGDWPGSFGYVKKWIQYLRREFDALAVVKRIVNDAPRDVVDRPFTPDERAKLSADLLSFAAGVGARFDSLKVQLDRIEERQDATNNLVNYLREASERMGTKDWINLALGAFIELAGSGLIPKDMFPAVWEQFVAAISTIRQLAE